MKYVGEYELKKVFGDIGYGLRTMKDVTLKSGVSMLVPTGVVLKLESYEYAFVKSSPSNCPCWLLCHFGGNISAGFKKELRVFVTNISGEDYKLSKGDLIGALCVDGIKGDFRIERVDNFD